MSTAPPPVPASHPAANKSVTIISHSTLFYWWPVWALGFIFALWTLYENTRVIHVPTHTKLELMEDGSYKLVGDKDAGAAAEHNKKIKAVSERYATETYYERKPPRVSMHSGLGTLYCIVLLVVIAITNIPLRGLWSVIVIVIVVLLSVIFAVWGVWDKIFEAIGNLHIYFGFAGYLFTSISLFAMWAVGTFLLDQRVYIVFTPGQMKVCEEVGGGEKAYDTIGMTIEKHRDDLFRHWVLGLGSGDLTVRTSGAQAHTIVMPNVLFVGRKLQQIEAMQREKQVVQA